MSRVQLADAAEVASGRRAEAGRILRFLVVGLGHIRRLHGDPCRGVEWFGASTVAGTAAAFVVGTAVSLVGNSLFVFRTAISAQTSGKFVIVTLFGLAANLFLSWSLDRLGLHYLVIAFAIFAIVPAMNYLLHRLWTFGRPKPIKTGGR